MYLYRNLCQKSKWSAKLHTYTNTFFLLINTERRMNKGYILGFSLSIVALGLYNKLKTRFTFKCLILQPIGRNFWYKDVWASFSVHIGWMLFVENHIKKIISIISKHSHTLAAQIANRRAKVDSTNPASVFHILIPPRSHLDL